MLERGMAPDPQLPRPCAHQRGAASGGASGGSLPGGDEGVRERGVERENLWRALARGKAHGGRPGVDGMTVEDLPGD
jgi:hypothetical protein